MHEVLVQLLWLVVEIFLSGGIDLSVGQRQGREEPWGRGFQLSSVAVRYRVLPSPNRPGLSLILLPLSLALVMHIWSRTTGSATRAKPSYLATWYGGAVIGIGLAAGRLFGLTQF